MATDSERTNETCSMLNVLNVYDPQKLEMIKHLLSLVCGLSFRPGAESACHQKSMATLSL